jgi:hypothetical protein
MCNPKPVSGVPDKNLISINSTRIHQYSYPDVDNIGAQRVQFMALRLFNRIQSKAEAFQYIPSHNHQWRSIRGSFLFTILATHSKQSEHETTKPFDLIVHLCTRQI